MERGWCAARAEIVEPGLVRAGGEELPYDHLLVATGSDPAAPPLDGIEDVEYWTSRDATAGSVVPERLVIVGGGAVGCELAQLYARLGSEIVLVQSGATLLDRIDAEAGELLAKALGEDGVEVRTGHAADRRRDRRRANPAHVRGQGGRPARGHAPAARDRRADLASTASGSRTSR